LLSALSGWPLTVVPVAAGIVVARRASLVRRLAEATASLRDEQRVRAQRLLGEERNRVARELHDVVAHHVSVMVIQTGGARLTAAGDPARAESALRVVERLGPSRSGCRPHPSQWRARRGNDPRSSRPGTGGRRSGRLSCRAGSADQ